MIYILFVNNLTVLCCKNYRPSILSRLVFSKASGKFYSRIKENEVLSYVPSIRRISLLASDEA